MKKTTLITTLLLITSACGINTARTISQPESPDLTSPDPVDTVQTTIGGSPSPSITPDLVIENQLASNQTKNILDTSTGATYTVLGKTSNKLLAETVKNGQSRTIGKLSLKAENISYDQRYELDVTPTTSYAINKLNIDVSLIKDNVNDDVWIAIPKMYGSALATLKATVIVESRPALYCAKAFVKGTGLLKLILNYECMPDQNCVTKDQYGNLANSTLDKAYNAGGYCLSNETYYQKKETKYNTITPKQALIEVAEDDPTQLKMIQLNLK